MDKVNQELKLTTILFRTFQHVQEVIKKDILSYDLNFAEFGALEALYHKGSLPIQSIGEKMLMANSSMTYVIDKLDKKGYITKIQDEHDRRNMLISLSDTGKTFFIEIFAKHKETLKSIYDILQVDEVNALSETLKKLGYHAKAIGGSK
jgi:MarR family 2-MHQ and catechol resistance regulon transcriptional repressor